MDLLFYLKLQILSISVLIYDPSDEGVIHWKDSHLAIDWPEDIEIKISEKDNAAPAFKSIFNL